MLSLCLLLVSLTFTTASDAAAPTIWGNPPTTATVGKTYRFVPRAYDRDGDRLRFAIHNKPSWASFDSRNGALTGVPRARHVGTYSNIRITVTDGRWPRVYATLGPFSITVPRSSGGGSGNAPPVISGTPSTQAVQGQVYSFAPKASDADGDPLTFGIRNRPSWTTFNSGTGLLRGTPGASDIGVYNDIQISVTDGKATVSLPAFSIRAEAVALGKVTLSWKAPTERTDGSSLNNLAGAKLHWGNSSREYTNTVRIDNPAIDVYVIENLPPGDWYFAVTAIDGAGVESEYSREASIRIN